MGDFYSYVAEVKYTSILSIEQYDSNAIIERLGWQWFELELLLAALRTKTIKPTATVYGGNLRVEIWEKGAKILRQAARDGLLDNDENQLSETVKQLRKEFPDLTSNVLDVRRQEECEQSVSNCVEAHGTVDILVNCAGIYPRVDILEIITEQWHLDLDINVLGTYFMMVAAYKVMQEKGFGRIVNISSIDAYIAHPTNAHYAASKAAVVSLTRSFAIAAASSGVTVNSVAPGPLAMEKAKQADWYEEAVKALPTGTPIEPKEIAETVAFLARPENRSITGENIIVSAGGVIA